MLMTTTTEFTIPSIVSKFTETSRELFNPKLKKIKLTKTRGIRYKAAPANIHQFYMAGSMTTTAQT
ncbi:hypothetical protein D3C76_1698940 [compost metagenome]